MNWEMHMVVLWVWVDIKDSSIHFGAIVGSFALYLVFKRVVFMFDNFPPFCSYSWQHVLCFSQTERECVVGGSQYAGLEERRAQGGGLHFTQRSVERVPILWEEEAACLFPTHRPLFSTNTLLRSTFSLVRTLWRAFNLLMTTMNNWKLLALSMKAKMCKFRNGSNPRTPSSNQIEP